MVLPMRLSWRLLGRSSASYSSLTAISVSSFHEGLLHTGVIFFDFPGASLQAKIEQLNSVLKDHADELARGEFIVVTPGQVRVASRPAS